MHSPSHWICSLLLQNQKHAVPLATHSERAVVLTQIPVDATTKIRAATTPVMIPATKLATAPAIILATTPAITHAKTTAHVAEDNMKSHH